AENIGILYGNLGTEGRVREHVVECPEASAPLHERVHLVGHKLPCSRGCIRVSGGNQLERVSLEYVTVAIVVHDHVHPRGLAEVGVDVDAPEVLTGVLAHLRVDAFKLLGHRLLDVRTARLAEEHLTHMGQRHDEETPASACWVEDLLARLRINDLYHHSDHVARSEELTTLAIRRCRRYR